jgi:hypothetical protein
MIIQYGYKHSTKNKLGRRSRQQKSWKGKIRHRGAIGGFTGKTSVLP